MPHCRLNTAWVRNMKNPPGLALRTSGAIICILALALFLLGAASGCGTASSSKASFTYAENSEPTSIDPALADEAVGINVDRYLFDGLVRYDSKTGEVKPGVAESWETSPDATIFTFHLRKGSRFTNGREVKAQDFVYSWTRALLPETKSGMALNILEPVKGAAPLADGQTKTLAGVQVVDDYTLRVTLEFPLAEFVTFLGHPVCSPVPQEEIEKAGAGFAQNPVGNGPFKLRELKANEQIVLDRNPDYYGDKPKVEEVTVKIIPSPATAVSELKAGNVDAVKSIPSGQAESLQSDSSVKIYEGKVNALSFVGFNMNVDPWTNGTLRQALNWAVDHQTIAGKVLQGQATPADGIVPTAMPGHQFEAMPYKYDPEKAKAVLAEAGYPNGEGLPPLKLSYRAEGSAADIAQAVQANLKAVGVNVELEGLESGAFLDKMLAGELGLFLAEWQADYNSPDTFLYPLFKSDSPQNVFGYAHTQLDEMLAKARSTIDKQERLKAYNDAERHILADAVVIPVVFGLDLIAYSPDVSNFVFTPLGDIALDEIAMGEK